MESIELLISCFRKSVPVVVYETSDPRASLRLLREKIKESFSSSSEEASVLSWDIAQGVSVLPGDSAGKNIASQFGETAEEPSFMLSKLADVKAVDGRFIMAVQNSQRLLDSFSFIQWVSNLRDPLRVLHGSNKRILVLMGTGIKIPPELENDVYSISEPLPDPERLKDVFHGLCKQTKAGASKEILENASRASVGVTMFAAENLGAMASTKEGLDIAKLWDSKAKKIGQTPGLQVISGGSFDTIGGAAGIKDFLMRLMDGGNRPNCIVFMDEIEKSFAGLQGDATGTTQDQLGILLQYMQDKSARGMIFYGPPGAAKSAVAKAAGASAKIPTIQFDLGALKGSYVGESERQIREALRVIDSVSGSNTLWIATCNSMAILPPELRRRFKLGTWFFDLPNEEEREKIWEIYAKKYEIPDMVWRPLLGLPWTGAEIENCCSLSRDLSVNLEYASDWIVPVAVSSKELIGSLRSSAVGKMLCASTGSRYGEAEESIFSGRVLEG